MRIVEFKKNTNYLLMTCYRTGEYFHNTILTDNVLRFLWDEDNVLDVQEVCFLHDKASCFKALATQELLRQSSIDFFNNSEWPGSSPELNPAEDLRAIIIRIASKIACWMKKVAGDIHSRFCCQTCKWFSTILNMTVNYSLNCYCHSGTGWMLLLLLLAATRITNF